VTNWSHVVYLDEQSKMQPGVSQQGAINSESIASLVICGGGGGDGCAPRALTLGTQPLVSFFAPG